MLGALHLASVLLAVPLLLQIIFGSAVYGAFMVLSGGIEKRELLFLANIVKGLRSIRRDDDATA